MHEYPILYKGRDVSTLDLSQYHTIPRPWEDESYKPRWKNAVGFEFEFLAINAVDVPKIIHEANVAKAIPESDGSLPDGIGIEVTFAPLSPLKFMRDECKRVNEFLKEVSPLVRELGPTQNGVGLHINMADDDAPEPEWDDWEEQYVAGEASPGTWQYEFADAWRRQADRLYHITGRISGYSTAEWHPKYVEVKAFKSTPDQELVKARLSFAMGLKNFMKDGNDFNLKDLVSWMKSQNWQTAVELYAPYLRFVKENNIKF